MDCFRISWWDCDVQGYHNKRGECITNNISTGAEIMQYVSDNGWSCTVECCKHDGIQALILVTKTLKCIGITINNSRVGERPMNPNFSVMK